MDDLRRFQASLCKNSNKSAVRDKASGWGWSRRPFRWPRPPSLASGTGSDGCNGGVYPRRDRGMAHSTERRCLSPISKPTRRSRQFAGADVAGLVRAGKVAGGGKPGIPVRPVGVTTGHHLPRSVRAKQLWVLRAWAWVSSSPARQGGSTRACSKSAAEKAVAGRAELIRRRKLVPPCCRM